MVYTTIFSTVNIFDCIIDFIHYSINDCKIDCIIDYQYNRLPIQTTVYSNANPEYLLRSL
jgi:hypothetical protein